MFEAAGGRIGPGVDWQRWAGERGAGRRSEKAKSRKRERLKGRAQAHSAWIRLDSVPLPRPRLQKLTTRKRWRVQSRQPTAPDSRGEGSGGEWKTENER